MSTIEPNSPLQQFQQIKAKALKNMGGMDMTPKQGVLPDRSAELRQKIANLTPLQTELAELTKTKVFQHKKGENMLTSCRNIFRNLKAKHEAGKWIKKIDHQVKEYERVIKHLDFGAPPGGTST